MQDYHAVLDFWFAEEHQAKHFAKDVAFDETIRCRFFHIWQSACRGELADWREDVSGRVAEIIVLDQFSRNLYRTSDRAFRQDTVALVLAQEALKHPDFARLPREYQLVVLMPFMHAESKDIQEESVQLFTKFGDEKKLGYAQRHKAIIDCFGRFPHRNALLGRNSTAEELTFLTDFTSF